MSFIVVKIQKGKIRMRKSNKFQKFSSPPIFYVQSFKLINSSLYKLPTTQTKFFYIYQKIKSDANNLLQKRYFCTST